jgi:hypothetical protein
VAAVQQEIQSQYPHIQMSITEEDDAGQIGRYASVLVMPTLVINEKVVCSGRFPSRQEVVGWLREAANVE